MLIRLSTIVVRAKADSPKGPGFAKDLLGAAAAGAGAGDGWNFPNAATLVFPLARGPYP